MTTDLVARLLERFELPFRDAGEVEARAGGATWRERADALGLACPASLVALGEAQRGGRIFFGRWELLTPETLDGLFAHLRDVAASAPCVEPWTRMLPLFTADGDLLVLSREGAIRRASVASASVYEHDADLAPSLDGLLERFLAGSRDDDDDDELSARDSTEALDLWWWADGIEYTRMLAHGHEMRDGAPICVTTLTIDLAPHYFRYPDGPGSRPLNGHVERARAPLRVHFEGAPLVVPRVTSDRVIVVGERRFDLLALAEDFLREGLRRGWTGRDGRARALDGWELLGVVAPARVVRF